MGHAFHACAALGTLTCALHHLVLRDIMEGVRVGEGEIGGREQGGRQREGSEQEGDRPRR